MSKQTEALKLAREAGLDPDLWNFTDAFERFAALVAAAEREACARMAEAFHHHQYDFTGNLELHEAIRARGEMK
jgi:hypothetical protein